MTDIGSVYLALKELDKYNYGDPWNYAFYELESPASVNGLEISVVATGGGMDKGSNAYLVLRVLDSAGTESFYRKDGFYASYDGFTWDGDFYEVQPKEKTVTVYEDSVGAKYSPYDLPDYDSFDSYDDSFGC